MTNAPIPESVSRSLILVLDRLSSVVYPWALTGSLSHALQGVDLAIHDIDIQTDRDGAQ